MTNALRPQLASALHWVRAQLEHSVGRARGLIEHCAEDDRDTTSLHQAFVELHQVRGTALMIRCHGAAALATEMSSGLQDLIHKRVGDREPLFATLLAATIQLNDYLLALEDGGEDCVLMLQPAINEIRLARGQPVLTEAELFVEQMRVLGLTLPQATDPVIAEGGAQQEARRLLPLFQNSLLAWIRNQSDAAGIARLGKIAEHVAQHAQLPLVHQLWRLVAAVVEAWLSQSLDDSLDLKRYIGRAGAQLKLLAEQGEAAAEAEGPALGLQLLFLVGRSNGRGARVRALREAFQLERYLPSPDQLEANRRRIHGPSTTLLAQVADEIRTEFSKVKDRIDLAVRTQGGLAEAEDTRASLKRIADTLAALGLDVLQRVVINQATALETVGEASAPTAWMEIATSILRVENSLEDALFQQLRQPRDLAVQPQLEARVPATRDLSEGLDALYRESMINLARIKVGVDAFLKNGSSVDLPEAVLQLDEIASGFEILGNDQAGALLRRLRRFVAGAGFAGLRETAQRADRFADAVACVEYYIESLRDRLPDAERMLGELARYLDQLEALVPALAESSFAPDPQPDHATEEAPQPMLEAQAQLVVEAPSLPSAVADVALLPEPEAVPVCAPPAPAAGDDDPEIREIFLEEAGEVKATLESTLNGWVRNPQDLEALGTIRRAFHTLKGSGRTVGATEIGDFGYAVENLLNRCLDGSIATSAGVITTVGDAVALLPALIEAFRWREPAQPAVAELLARARDYSEGRDPSATPEADMASIFREDAREKLAEVLVWTARLDRALSQHRVDPGVKRAFHTLRGAARVVSAAALSEVAGALEAYLDSLEESHLPLNDQGLTLIEDATALLQRWVEEVGTRAVQTHDAAPWLQRVQGLQGDMPVTARADGSDRELIEIFTHEAFDLVLKMEEALRGWVQVPSGERAPQDLKLLSHTLKGAALMSNCQAIGEAARVLQDRLQEVLSQRLVPDAPAFTELAAITELFYQQLDAYRDGALESDSQALVDRIQHLCWKGEAAGAVAVAMPVVSAAEPAVDEDSPAEVAPAAVEPPVVALTPPAAQVLELIGAQAPATHTTPDEDPELLSIFIAEAEELLEVLDQAGATLERDAGSGRAISDLQRVLHTFKGSARMAGLMPLGEVAHRLESLLESVTRSGSVAHRDIFSRLQNATDALHGAVDDLKRGVIPDMTRALEELEAAPGDDSAAPTDTSAPAPLQPAAEPPAPLAPLRAAGAAQAVVDHELIDVFAGEALELFDQLESAGRRWQALPSDAIAVQDMQRALHTLKGGARMSGMMVLGDAAHDLETLLAEQGADAGGDAELRERVSRAMADLRRMVDALERREYQTLLQAEAHTTPAAPAAAGAVTPAPAPAAREDGWDPELFWHPSERAGDLLSARRETARVAVETLDLLLNEAGEISIHRSRLEEHNAGMQAQLDEVAQAIQRIREQMRQLQAETDAQIAARGLDQTENADRYAGEFDPLEMDRYTRMQELARALNESISDLAALHEAMEGLAGEAATILLQQGRVNTEVQQGLMRTLMVPFSRQVARLQRVVQQAAQENGKRAELRLSGVEAEMDRSVLERMTAPLEHLLRNAVVHGIEMPDARSFAGKNPVGRISITLGREGTQLFIELRDDGRGLDFAAIRETAIKRGLMPEGVEISDDEAAQFIFVPGFSTARRLTQDAGRGVGMDVVAGEVKQLGGTLELASDTGRGARFLIRLPLTLAMSQALLVGVGVEQFAVPLSSIEGIARLPSEDLARLYADESAAFLYGGAHYRVRYLGDFVGSARDAVHEAKTVHAILVRLPEGLGTGERRVAVVVDALIGNREIVSKALGAQVSAIPGVTGATILADGRVVLIVDVVALVQDSARRSLRTLAAAGAVEDLQRRPDVVRGELIMVVDDSITIRRVTERLLVKNGYRVLTAKDGLDAMAQLQTESPAAILLDIEMPRADGFEVATFVRNSPRITQTPIVMITSRSGDKHRERARSIGVDRYLIKPYLEDQLLEELRGVIKSAGATA